MSMSWPPSIAFLAALSVFATPGAAQSVDPAMLGSAEIEMSVRRGDALEAVRVTRFTPRVAAVEALDGALADVAPQDAPQEILGVSAVWGDPLRRLFGVDGAVALSGAVAPGSAGAAQDARVAFGATVSTLGVDVSGRYVHAEGGQDDAMSFGASAALGDWTLGGAVSLEMDESGSAGAQLGASFLAAPGVQFGGSVALSNDDGDSGRSGLRGGGRVGAGVSVRLDF